MPDTASRVVSLLPGATEIIAALGAGERLVAISHECDHPPDLTHLPRITSSPIDPTADSAAIDAAVREAVSAGRPVIAIDQAQLAALRPDLLVTQALCEVCAVSDGAVHRLGHAIAPAPAVLAMDGTTLAGVLADIDRIATALGLADRGARLVASLRQRLETLRDRFHRARPVSTMVIEWLEPCFLAGHWTPEIVAAAGGCDIAMRPGAHSTPRDWSEIVALDPEVVVVALCGFDEARARAELDALDRPAVNDWLAARRVVVIDGNSYTSRAGPRLVDAVEVLGELLDGGRNDGSTEGGG